MNILKKITLFVLVQILINQSFAQLNISFLSKKTYPSRLSNLWGYVDPLSNKEYALVGGEFGTSIVDISNPLIPVEVALVPAPVSKWREIKTYSHYAYVTNEEDSGLQIIDLADIANGNVTSTFYMGLNYPFHTAHTLFIDEHGVCYLFGASFGNKGVIMLDLTVDPLNPVELGSYQNFYIHDGFVRGDTLWAAAIYDGFIGVVNVANKANPQLIAQWNTPGNFAHNVWPTDDNKYLFTTDEITDSWVTSYDVQDFSNVMELDRYQSNHSADAIAHNTYYSNKYLFTSYYRDGVTLVDATYPYNLIETGHYDTSPLLGDGFNGAWGVYPFLPSGNLIVSDMEEGLFVLAPTYTKACYLEGNITDSACNAALNAVKIEILGTPVTKYSLSNGHFATGYVIAGNYSIRLSKFGYQTKIIHNVSLNNGVLTNLNTQMVALSSTYINGNIQSQNASLSNASILFKNDSIQYQFFSDIDGNFSKCNLITGVYDIYINKWGYQSICIDNQSINSSNNTFNYNLELGYQDEFNIDLGWTVTSTASSGIWKRAVPVGTQLNGFHSNANTDILTDCGDFAYVTGNNPGNAWDDDVDDGNTVLTSPTMDLSTYLFPSIEYYTWFFNKRASGNDPYNDFLKVSFTNGIDTIPLSKEDTSKVMSAWIKHAFFLKDLIAITSTCKLIVEVADVAPGHITEGGLDGFQIFDAPASTHLKSGDKNTLQIFPNPSYQENIYIISSKNVDQYAIYDVFGKMILQADMPKGNEINIASIKTGVYLIHFYDKKKELISVEKWIKLN